MEKQATFGTVQTDQSSPDTPETTDGCFPDIEKIRLEWRKAYIAVLEAEASLKLMTAARLRAKYFTVSNESAESGRIAKGLPYCFANREDGTVDFTLCDEHGGPVAMRAMTKNDLKELVYAITIHCLG